jgi:hypothetical protein
LKGIMKGLLGLLNRPWALAWRGARRHRRDTQMPSKRYKESQEYITTKLLITYDLREPRLLNARNFCLDADLYNSCLGRIHSVVT